MSEDQNQVVTLKVRVSPEFREKIVATAKQNTRSMNAEIVKRLEDSFQPDSFKITKFNDTEEPTASIEIGAITIGLSESKYKEVKLVQIGINYWVFSYHGVLCHLSDDSARQLIALGCTAIPL